MRHPVDVLEDLAFGAALAMLGVGGAMLAVFLLGVAGVL